MILELDEYEIANLYHALKFVGQVGGDTGDWYNQILFKIESTHIPMKTMPNKQWEFQLEDLIKRIGFNVLKK